MQEYLLFIDTEASGLPKSWHAHYSNSENWPNAVQISWIIFTKDGKELKTENHYVSDEDFTISPSAIKIHGITRDFLKQTGESRKEVLEILSKDIKKYQPLIIGHFLELDLHVLRADFHRANMEDPLKERLTFCTMLGTKQLVRNPNVKYLRLGELYSILFNRSLEQQHNAIVDARGTSDCYFELIKRGEIDNKKIEQQQLANNTQFVHKKSRWILVILIILVLILLILLLS